MNSTDETAPIIISSSSSGVKSKSPRKSPRKSKPKPTPTPTTVVEDTGYFGKHDTPDERWFKTQLNKPETTALEVVEFFHLFSVLKTDLEKIQLLRKAKNDRVIMLLLNMNYTPSMYDLFKPDSAEVAKCRLSQLPWGINPFTLRQQYRRLAYLINSNAKGAKLDSTTQGKIYYEFMESLHASEAKIFNQCFTQTLDVPGLSPQLVKKAFGIARFPEIKD